MGTFHLSHFLLFQRLFLLYFLFGFSLFPQVKTLGILVKNMVPSPYTKKFSFHWSELESRYFFLRWLRWWILHCMHLTTIKAIKKKKKLLAAAAKSLQSWPTLCDPINGSPPSLGFSRQEHWSELPFLSPMHEREKWKWSRSVVSDSSRLHGLQPTRLLRPWDFPGKSTGVGCHCLLQKRKLLRWLLLAVRTKPSDSSTDNTQIYISSL